MLCSTADFHSGLKLSLHEKLLYFWYFHAKSSLGLTEKKGVKKRKKKTSEWQYIDKNASLMLEIKREVRV